MSHWNYRLVKREWVNTNESGYTIGIHECYYDDDGKIENITEDTVSLELWSNFEEDGRISKEHIIDEMDKMREAINKPVIDYETLKEIDLESDEDTNNKEV